jgi:hypothetical protein
MKREQDEFMKAYQESLQVFNPVVLTLETQAEVDAIFACLNHADVAQAIGLSGKWNCLAAFKSLDYNKIHFALCGIIK